MAGVFTMSSQTRIVSHLPTLWFCDQEPVKEVMKKDTLGATGEEVVHLTLPVQADNSAHQGSEERAVDYLSRHNFQEDHQVDLEAMAQDAFQRMDMQLDLRMEHMLTLQCAKGDLENSEFKEIWEKLEPFKAKLIEEKLWYKTEDKLFCERKLVIPKEKMGATIAWCHEANGHPGISRTL